MRELVSKYRVERDREQHPDDVNFRLSHGQLHLHIPRCRGISSYSGRGHKIKITKKKQKHALRTSTYKVSELDCEEKIYCTHCQCRTPG